MIYGLYGIRASCNFSITNMRYWVCTLWVMPKVSMTISRQASLGKCRRVIRIPRIE